ncbi:uroporphyrinogen-III synthase [Aquibacillus koreensis]|uniref:Uroporphyrinogen-III synthase n=1 Tax=Aquibacillus koreensis TaxID=279446 RepID=A0A9X3WKX6_9BACI|nr:uroporphyrinogen-III synthase [Aquibacillus koreensis]MCT2537930.1 uroporphyrinogen-III synthase [Aquibacillus koreensis]MDC3419179.1 uroporphyrinogen-III synthase [Aquibacillus koreensis]
MSRPLSGKRILVTRAKEQTKEFSEKMKEVGAIPVVVPLLHIRPTYSNDNRVIFQNLHDFTWIFFTSANGVKFFFQQLYEYGFDKNWLSPLQIAVVGDKTEMMLNHYGCTAEFKPRDFSGEAMMEEFLKDDRSNERIVLACGNRSRQEIPCALEQHDIFYKRLITYETLINADDSTLLEEYIASGEIDIFTFTSPSAVEALHRLINTTLFEKIAREHLCVCIGSTTEKKALELGLKQVLVPDTFTIEGMLQVLIDYYKAKG